MKGIIRFFDKASSRYLPWAVWAIAAIFYSYEFFLRISPSVMVFSLMRDFQVTAELVGTLSAVYYYAYAIMQIPVGMLIDYCGVRMSLTVAAFLVTVGCALFAVTDIFGLAKLGRVFMGVGSAFAFVGCLKLSVSWFPKSRFALVIGLTNMLGVLGAISAEAPLAILTHKFGWRFTMVIAATIGAIITLSNNVFIKDKPLENVLPINKAIGHPFREILTGLRYLIASRNSWLVAIFGCLMVAPIAAFTELWSVPYLREVYDISNAHAAALSSLIFIGIALGGPIHGWLSGYFQRRKIIMAFGAVVAFISLVMILYMKVSNDVTLASILLLFGFATSSMLLCFAVNCEINPSEISGTVVGFTNMLVMLGGTIFQPLIGFLLDHYWTGKLDAGARVFSIADYHISLSVLPLCLLVAMVILFFIPETYRSDE